MGLLPSDVRNEVRERVWKQAREMRWVSMSLPDKAVQYANWVADPNVGGVLGRYLEPKAIRVYLKDTLIKEFVRHERSDSSQARRVLGIAPNAQVRHEYSQPHGLCFEDGRVIAWGRADDWKAVLMALHERIFGCPGLTAHGVLLTEASRRFQGSRHRAVVEDAAKKLGVQRVVWISR